MKWLYKYLAERQDVLRTHETHYKRWLARLNQQPADRETQELLATVIWNLAVSRDECDRLMRFITHWSRHEHDNPEPGAQVPGWPPRVPPTASPPHEAGQMIDLTSDTLFQQGVRVALDWASRNRSDNVRTDDLPEVLAWLKLNKKE